MDDRCQRADLNGQSSLCKGCLPLSIHPSDGPDCQNDSCSHVSRHGSPKGREAMQCAYRRAVLLFKANTLPAALQCQREEA